MFAHYCELNVCTPKTQQAWLYNEKASAWTFHEFRHSTRDPDGGHTFYFVCLDTGVTRVWGNQK